MSYGSPKPGRPEGVKRRWTRVSRRWVSGAARLRDLLEAGRDLGQDTRIRRPDIRNGGIGGALPGSAKYAGHTIPIDSGTSSGVPLPAIARASSS